MPAYITIPVKQSYVIISPPVLEPGIPGYSWGSNNDYANAPNSNVEVGETMPANGTAGRQFNLRKFPGTSNSRAITWSYSFPSQPTSGALTLEGAVRDEDAEYAPIDVQAAALVGGEVRAVSADNL